MRESGLLQYLLFGSGKHLKRATARFTVRLPRSKVGAASRKPNLVIVSCELASCGYAKPTYSSSEIPASFTDQIFKKLLPFLNKTKQKHLVFKYPAIGGRDTWFSSRNCG